MHRSIFSFVGAVALAVGLIASLSVTPAVADEADRFATTTPIKHLVIIFQENETFDHYFGTYPNAANPAGEPQFFPAHDTPSVNGFTPTLLNSILTCQSISLRSNASLYVRRSQRLHGGAATV